MSDSDAAQKAISALLDLMVRLRDPRHGCPWDQKQTFASIAPYTIEEAYEVADAIERGDPDKIRDELGDLLFQVVFHAQMARERGWFDFAQVAQGIHEKLVRRHPHVFGGVSVSGGDAELARIWEEQKARERSERHGVVAGGAPAEVSALADIPFGLPALVRAAKLGRRAGRVGFDWPDAPGVRDKVLEELREVDVAVAAHDQRAVQEEMGDLLFALANWSRHLKVDAEDALRGANSKFHRRFRAMEDIARQRGVALSDLGPEEWEALWQESKRQERSSSS